MTVDRDTSGICKKLKSQPLQDRIRLGDIVPAEARIMEGGPVEVDQSALTGESLPVTCDKSDSVYSGSIIRRGETNAVVYGTGLNTYFGERVFHLDRNFIQTLIYLKLSLAGHLTIFITRTRRPFWSVRPARILILAVLGTQMLATLLAVYGFLMPPIGWNWTLEPGHLRFSGLSSMTGSNWRLIVF